MRTEQDSFYLRDKCLEIPNMASSIIIIIVIIIIIIYNDLFELFVHM
jgi:hypothetical protein